MQVLKEYIMTGWPSQKSKVQPEACPYFNELSVQEGILFKGSRIIIPVALRREMLRKVHEGHLGIESCLKRAREALYWPLMSSEIKDYVSNCSICNTIQPSQAREPLVGHKIPTRPWSKVATDLFVYNGDNFVVIVDYYSNFIEVERVKSTSSQSVTQVLKTIFGRNGIPDTDNGPTYA